MKMRCQDGSIEITPDFTDDVVTLTVRDDTGRAVSVTLSRAKALLVAVEIDTAEANLAEYDK